MKKQRSSTKKSPVEPVEHIDFINLNHGVCSCTDTLTAINASRIFAALELEF
jgi:hypothetical protein